MKFLFIPGFGKAGTTYLYGQLAKHSELFNLPHTKETGAFYRKIGREKYLENFLEQDENKTFIDGTAHYLVRNSTYVSNIKHALTNDDIRLLIGIRCPIRRAYSHYLYRLRTAWRIGVSAYPFHDPRILTHFLYPMRPLIAQTQHIFGSENVAGFSFEGGPVDVPQSFKTFLGLDDNWAVDPGGDRYDGGWAPEIYYDAKDALVVESAGSLYELPRRTLLISAGIESVLKFNFPAELGERLMRNSATWTRSFESRLLGDALSLALDDYAHAREMLGLAANDLMEPGTLSAKRPPALPLEIAKLLKPLGALQERFRHGYDAHAGLSLQTVSADVEAIRKEIDSHYAAISNDQDAGASEEAIKQQIFSLVEALDSAISIRGPDPDYVQEFILLCFVSGQGARAYQTLRDNPHYFALLDKQILLEKADYFRNQIGDGLHRRLMKLVETLQISPSI
ncbi:hypothetical protein ACETRX_14760 [Labrys portucalensis]|uniref:Sulfotransferase n=1 Tax=Labrys neptuniae TaxID=376174 RepID=A0ABV6ZFB7_9HYPH